MTQLIEAVRAVGRGETMIPSRMLGSLISSLVRRRRGRDRAGRIAGSLTRREREVLFLLADGADNDGIAQALVISPQTVRTHIQNVLSKLGVHSRLEAASFVIRNDLRDELEASVP
jgi:two-component system, NarL family, nitrate/nitrite response regulator NarL